MSQYKPRKKLDGGETIKACIECSHLRGVGTCIHPKRKNLHCKVKWSCCVPIWCPLPKTGRNNVSKISTISYSG